MQQDLKEGLVSELKPIREGMKNFTKSITFPQFSSIIAYSDDSEEGVAIIGDIAEQYLRKFASDSGVDKTFGFLDKDGKFYIGNQEAKIYENNIIVFDKEYFGTPGLWELFVELIMATTSGDKIFTNGNYDNYFEIMHSINALMRNNDESETTKAANGSTY